MDYTEEEKKAWDHYFVGALNASATRSSGARVANAARPTGAAAFGTSTPEGIVDGAAEIADLMLEARRARFSLPF